jgi:hypothetical protein
MTDYRCYCLHTNGRVHLATAISADGDEQALERGADLFDDCVHDTVEIWDGIRCVGRVKKGVRMPKAPVDRPADVAPTHRAKD